MDPWARVSPKLAGGCVALALHRDKRRVLADGALEWVDHKLRDFGSGMIRRSRPSLADFTEAYRVGKGKKGF